ncbi:MAG TPA: lytic transglycosylase domain-containing protein [Clostridiales bacterium]|nr:lytic transglycosylase domain-containing protein [Clostridiales bacterium]
MNLQRKSGVGRFIFLLVAILILAGCTRLATLHFYRAAYPIHYRETVLACAKERGLAPELVFAVIHCESGFDHQAVSHVEARGLMQITEDTFEWARWRMGDDEDRTFGDMFVPETNIRYGTAILWLLTEEFKGEREVLAAYHAGWGNVKDWLAREEYSRDGSTLDHIPFGDTRAYVAKVLETKKIYSQLYQF